MGDDLTCNQIFDEIEDDQYDFHGYSLRKFTVSIYLKLLKWEDTLREHPAYLRAAIGATKVCALLQEVATGCSSVLDPSCSAR